MIISFARSSRTILASRSATCSPVQVVCRCSALPQEANSFPPDQLGNPCGPGSGAEHGWQSGGYEPGAWAVMGTLTFSSRVLSWQLGKRHPGGFRFLLGLWRRLGLAFFGIPGGLVGNPRGNSWGCGIIRPFSKRKIGHLRFPPARELVSGGKERLHGFRGPYQGGHNDAIESVLPGSLDHQVLGILGTG